MCCEGHFMWWWQLRVDLIWQSISCLFLCVRSSCKVFPVECLWSHFWVLMCFVISVSDCSVCVCVWERGDALGSYRLPPLSHAFHYHKWAAEQDEAITVDHSVLSSDPPLLALPSPFYLPLSLFPFFLSLLFLLFFLHVPSVFRLSPSLSTPTSAPSLCSFLLNFPPPVVYCIPICMPTLTQY